MKLLLLAIVAALSSSAVANRHHKCYCYSNADDGLYEPDNEKTTKMCDSYKKRIGNKFYEWDTCPDCKYEVVEDYVDEGTPPGWCSSAGKHLGGKELKLWDLVVAKRLEKFAETIIVMMMIMMVIKISVRSNT
ncbi:hypothetical protein IAQ61_011382 [Plenodomus lingam]|uniref:uncharacterized protein n=1 Tax=Leptosphaeria maculans TaxID=5022 RepID=UPI003327B901|nr:hypothetical protein IAQ61_011382 [Plenodomus lingam]